MNYSEMDSLFHPRSIAIIGAATAGGPYSARSYIIRIMIEYGFPGEVYPVNISGGQIMGRKVYTSLKEIPCPIDYAFIQIPAQHSIQIIRECGQKGIKLAALFTSGFGESESEIEGGSRLEHELVKTAQESGVKLLGPNCMGFYSPEDRLCYVEGAPVESGPVGVLFQSGGNSCQLIRAGAQRGLRFSKVVSFGNAADINEADLMEYFAQDPNTKIIIGYLEGMREGRRFLEAVKQASRTKPVILIKGGETEGGAATASSHTGSMAVPSEIWNSVIRQSGAIPASGVDESVDVALAFMFMLKPQGRRAAIIGFGGGASVQAADDCHRARLSLPPLSDSIRQELRKSIGVPGNILRNPVDFSNLSDPREMGRVVKLVADSEGIDFLILHMGVELGGITLPQMVEPMAQTLISAARNAAKPVAVSVYGFYALSSYEAVVKAQRVYVEAGLPFYPSIQRATNAIDKMMRYYETKPAH